VTNPKCKHEFVDILLLSKTVRDCKHCGMQEEDYLKKVETPHNIWVDLARGKEELKNIHTGVGNKPKQANKFPSTDTDGQTWFDDYGQLWIYDGSSDKWYSFNDYKDMVDKGLITIVVQSKQLFCTKEKHRFLSKGIYDIIWCKRFVGDSTYIVWRQI